MNERDLFRPIYVTLRSLGCDIWACGSRVTNNPPPEGADHDMLVLVPHSAYQQVAQYLTGEGYKTESDEYIANAPGPSEFKSWRLLAPGRTDKVDSVNLLLVTDLDFARKHNLATQLCRRLNLPKRGDRVAVFQAILYGNAYTED